MLHDDENLASLKDQFHADLVNAVNVARLYTPLGIKQLQSQLEQRNGADLAKLLLQEGEQDLRRLSVLSPSHDYLQAVVRIGHPELAIEHLVIDQRWQGLFSGAEQSRANRRLTQYASSADNVPRPLPVLSPILFELFRVDDFHWEPLFHNSECEAVAQVAESSAGKEAPLVSCGVRVHLSDCAHCNQNFASLLQDYEKFDRKVLDILDELFRYFEVATKLAWPDLERFMNLQRDEFFETRDPDDENAEIDWEVTREIELSEFIEPAAYWRALRLGTYIGRIMKAFAKKFPAETDVWLDWWSSGDRNLYTEFLKAVGAKRFQLALHARNIAALNFETLAGNHVFWLPVDEDLNEIPGVLWVEYAPYIGDWQDIQGKGPVKRNLKEIFESTSMRDFERLTHGLAGQLAAGNEFSQLQGLLSPTSAAEFWETKMPSVWARCSPDTKNFLVSSHQLFESKLAAPSIVICSLAQAYEHELKLSILMPLFRALRLAGKKEILHPVNANRVVWRSDWSPHRQTLEKTHQLLDHLPDPDRFLRTNRQAIMESIVLIKEDRNRACHGGSMRRLEVETIWNRWLHFGGYQGGIFAALYLPTN